MIARSTVAGLALALTLTACGTRQPVAPPTPEQLAAMEEALARREARLDELTMEDEQQSPVVTRVSFDPGRYKPGFERLRAVNRQNTVNNVAGQVVLNVALFALAGGAGVAPFSKDELAGDALSDLAAEDFAVNPALKELPERLGPIATQAAVQRAKKAVALAKNDGSTLEEILAAAELPDAYGWPVTPGPWHLVYENLLGNDQDYRLKFGASLGSNRPGVHGCLHISEPLPWQQWQADGWQRVRDERAKALSHCEKVLGALIRGQE